MVVKYAVFDESAPKGNEEDGCPQTLPQRDLRSHLSHSGGRARGLTASCSLGGDRTEATISIFPAALSINQQQAIHTENVPEYSPLPTSMHTVPKSNQFSLLSIS